MRTSRRRGTPRAGMQAPKGKLAEATRLAREHLTRAERLFSAGKGRPGSAADETSHLWEHSRLVAGLARRLAEAEGGNGDEAYLAGLLHDAGKFAGGRYHADDAPEEKASAKEAQKIIERSGYAAPSVRRIAAAVAALYREGSRPNRLADVVHDADFLAKSGRLGVAQFFIKATLRGQGLARMVSESLSRELTYAEALPANMRTAAGRRLARSRAAETRRYFCGLLREIEEARGLRFTMRRLKINILPPMTGAFSARAKAAAHGGRFKAPLGPVALSVPVTLVHPRACGRCGGRWRLVVSTERGVKCERLEARLTCASCGDEQRASFCLPEISLPRRPAARP